MHNLTRALGELKRQYSGDHAPRDDDFPTEYPESADGEPIIEFEHAAKAAEATTGAGYNGFAFQRFSEMRGTIAKRHLIKGVSRAGKHRHGSRRQAE